MNTVPELMNLLRARLVSLKEEHDEEGLFGPESDDLADRLSTAMFTQNESGESQVHLAAALLLVEFHQTRHYRRPDPEFTDLGIAGRLMSLAASLDHRFLTPQFQASLTEMHHQAEHLDKQAQKLLEAYQNEKRLTDLETAISKYTAAVNLCPMPGPAQALVLSHLSSAFLIKFQDENEAADLERALTLRHQALAITPDDDPARTLRMSILADLYGSRFELSGEAEDLRKAIQTSREVLTATPEGDGHVALRSDRLGRLLAREFATTENLATLDEAITLGYCAMDNLTEEDEPDTGAYVSNLSSWLVDRADHTGNTVDLDAAIALRRTILEGATGDVRLLRLMSLGTTLYRRYERTGRIDDLSEAVEVERLALAGTPPGHPERRSRLTNLATSLRVRYEWLRHLPDLDEAIKIGTEGVQLSDGSHALTLTNLSMAFVWRFRHLFEPADLARAISLAERAVENCPPDHPDRGMALANLVYVHNVQPDTRGEEVDANQLIAWNREAVAVTPRVSPSRIGYMSNLGMRLARQYENTGDTDFLREAIAVLEETMKAATAKYAFRHLVAANLARALATTSDQDGGSPKELDRAITLMRDLREGPGHTKVFVLLRLAELLSQRYQRRGDHIDLQEANDCWHNVMNSQAALAEERLEAATARGRMAFEMEEFDSAANTYELAMRLLSKLTWHGLSWNARQKHLTDWSDIAGNTAAALLAAHRPERAVEVLEEGRSVLWNQLLRIRTDLSELDAGAPELATRLRLLNEKMDAPGMAVEDDLGPMNDERLLTQSARERRIQEQLRITEQWDELVAEVQEIPELRHLFAPTPFTELSTAATDGPVVIVNVSQLGCHALMVTGPDDVDFIELPDLALRDAMERAVAFLNTVIRSQQRERPFIERERDRHEVFDLLEWMWNAICSPVFERLGLTATDGSPPRLWWCPTNVLALLPLHAAGLYSRHSSDDHLELDASVADHVVSSYTPTLTALRRLRLRAQPSRSPQVLAIAMPTTPDRSPLPGVVEELTVLTEKLAERAELRQLIGSEATRDAVLEVLADYTWVHFACHADQDLMHPGAGSFSLADGPLPLLELADVKLTEPELAYLSACETAAGGAQLPDEAIHLAAAMQLIGYRHVVATMWHIADNSAPKVAADVYDQLARRASPDASDTARALHKAVGALRAAHPTDPLRWAPYVHLGP